MKTKYRVELEGFFRERIAELEQGERYSTARNYKHTWESFHKFLDGRVFFVDELRKETVANYNRFLRDSGLQRNTISFYNRVLRSVYNQAVKEGYARQVHPFAEVYTGVDATRKRALPVESLRRMARLPLEDPELALARDLFLFSFQARGMSFVDMAFLTHQNVRAGSIQYVRRKTGQPLIVRIEAWMQAILDRYADQCYGPYLLPILTTLDPKEAYAQYAVQICRHNRLLRKLGKLVGTDLPISSYYARHSWATLARDASIPLSVISSGMGHTSERTTQIYLDTLDNSLVDQANRQIWEQIEELK